MIKKRIIDLTQVTRIALENAASVACMMLTTSVTITDIPEKEDKTDHLAVRMGESGEI